MLLHKLAVLLASLLLISNVRCEDAETDDCENNPQDEEIAKEFKHMAMLGYDIGSQTIYACHGVLIHESYVLTTAECSKKEFVGQPIIVRLGVSCKHFQYINISSIVIHPDFDPNSPTPNEIRSVGLVKLEAPAETTDYVAPTKLHKTKVSDKQQPIEAAWVARMVNDVKFTVVVKYHLTVVPYSQCSESYQTRNPPIVINKKSEVCAYPVEEAENSIGIIHLMKSGKLQPVGIMAGGAGDPPTETFPSIYVRISHYISWIRDNMK